MSIGFSCDDCGRCDDCRGIVWPAGPAITPHQASAISASMKLFGAAFARKLDEDVANAFK